MVALGEVGEGGSWWMAVTLVELALAPPPPPPPGVDKEMSRKLRPVTGASEPKVAPGVPAVLMCVGEQINKGGGGLSMLVNVKSHLTGADLFRLGA